MPWYVYILQCSDKRKSLYVGITNDVKRRVEAHNNGKGAKFTKGRAPVFLLKTFAMANKSQALKLEYQIKKMTKREKLSLIKEDA